MHYFSIVLKSDKDRVKHVLQNHVKNINKNNYQIIHAIEGRTNQLEYELKDRKINERFLNYALRGQIACILSHLKVYQIMQDKNISEAIILEDDTQIPNNFCEEIRNMTPIIKERNLDFFYLFIHPDCFKNMEKIDEKFYRGKTYGTVGYYITKKFAKGILQFCEKELFSPIDETISWLLENKNKNYLCINLVNTIGSLYCNLNVVLTVGLGSNVGKTALFKDKKDIKFTYYLDEGDYLYYPHCTTIDGNMSFSNELKGTRIEKVDPYKELFLKEDNIFGFSTDGWIKNKISDKWKLSNSGLYIKKDKKFKRRKCILLTGGAGFIGSHCALDILQDKDIDEDVIIVDNFSNSDKSIIENLKLFEVDKKLHFYQLDICDKNQLEIVFKYHDITSVIHFAAFKSVGESVNSPLKYYQNNLINLMNVLECMNKYKVKNIIFSSSATVYGNPEYLPLTEDARIQTLNPYGRTKYFAEEILKDISASHEIKVINLRYFNPVGASQTGLFKENPKGIPNNLFPYIMLVIKGEREFLSIYGNDYPTIDGTGVRDYIHVEDLAEGHVAALKNLNEIKENFITVNLGTGKGYSVLQVVNKFNEFLKILDKTLPYKFVERRKGDAAEVYADVSLAKKLFNWKAKRDLDDMVKSCLNI